MTAKLDGTPRSLDTLGRGTPWTDELEQKLRKLWGDGLSCSQISTALNAGFSRNAIIGKKNRLGLEDRRPAVFKLSQDEKQRRERARQRNKPKPQVKVLVNHGNRLDYIERNAPMDLPKQDAVHGPFLPLLALPDRKGCRNHPWDLNAPGAGFCGNEGYPWCAFAHSLPAATNREPPIHPEARMTAMQILRETAQAYFLTPDQVKSPSRQPNMVRARMDAAQRMWFERGMSSGEIARFLNRSPWTCRYYVNQKMRTRHQKRKLAAWWAKRVPQ